MIIATQNNASHRWSLVCLQMILYFLYYLRYDGEGLFICGLGVGEFVEVCEATHERETLRSTEELDRSFGGTGGVCKAASNAATPKPALAAGLAAFGVVALQMLGIF